MSLLARASETNQTLDTGSDAGVASAFVNQGPATLETAQGTPRIVERETTPLATEAGQPTRTKDADQLLITIESIAHIKDLDTLLERVLYEARRFVGADAGTIYLRGEDQLYFNYVQNDTLFQNETPSDKYVYSQNKITISKSSLAGYVALTGESLLIDNVYDIKSNVTYSFNASFDTKSSYKTRSILVVPLMTRDETNVGVLQLINAKDEAGTVIPFSMQDRICISQFAQNAASAIERAKLAREMVFRMVDVAELRDPYETTQHARRVGSYAIEIYQKWGERRGLPQRQIDKTKEYLWSAAILHDVGKVAVSDAVLRKNGELTYAERNHIRYHTIFGARLFRNSRSPWDTMAAEVSLNHHEHWDGTGYPGHIEDINTEKVYFGPGKTGEEIPISARIVAIADVYDALVSQRAYKPAWKNENALKHIHLQSGKHFDPEVADVFLDVHEVMVAIRERYPEKSQS